MVQRADLENMEIFFLVYIYTFFKSQDQEYFHDFQDRAQAKKNICSRA